MNVKIVVESVNVAECDDWNGKLRPFFSYSLESENGSQPHEEQGTAQLEIDPVKGGHSFILTLYTSSYVYDMYTLIYLLALPWVELIAVKGGHNPN